MTDPQRVQAGSLVHVVGEDDHAVYVVERIEMVDGIEVAIFVDGQGWWRTAALEIANAD